MITETPESNTVKSDNELIAEFMGVDKVIGDDLWYFKNPPPFFAKHQSKLYYNVSWDWLMPVVHKILKTTEPSPGQGWSYQYIQLEKTRVGNTIDFVYQRVVDFVKWYNQQPHKV